LESHKKALMLFVLAMTGILLSFYWPWLAGQQEFFYKDVTTFFEPLCRFIGDAFRSGRLPLWNPYGYCGMSQAAISSPSIFFPPDWLFAVLSFSQALAAILLFSQLICAIGTYLLVRSLGWSPVASWVAGAALSLSGYMFSLSSNYTLVANAAWIPMVLYCTRQCVLRGTIVWLSAQTVSVFFLLSAGRPEVSAPGLVLSAGVAFQAWWQQRKSSSTGTNVSAQLSVLVKGTAVGVLLSMPTILPSLEWLPLSRRSEGLPSSEILMYSANWYNLLCLWVPQPLGDLQLRNSPFSELVLSSSLVPYYDSAFIGAPVVALALMGLTKRGGLAYWSTVLVLVSSMLVSLGGNLPYLGELLVNLPGASFIRFPSKLLFFSILCLALLAARGAERLLTGKIKLLPHLIFWSGGTVLFAGMLMAKQTLLPFLNTQKSSLELVAQNAIAQGAVVQCLIVVVSIATTWWLIGRKKQLLALTGACVIAIGSLSYNAFANYKYGAAPGYFAQPSPVLQGLRRLEEPSGLFRLTSLYLEHFTVPDGIDTKDRLASTIADFQYARSMAKPFSNVDFRVPSAFGFEGSMVGEYYYFFLNSYIRSSQSGVLAPDNRTDLQLYRLLQCGSTTHVITQIRQVVQGAAYKVPALDSRMFELVFHSTESNAQVYKLKRPLPRAYLTANWRYFADRDALIARMENAQQSGFDPEHQTLVETEIEAAETGSDSSGSSNKLTAVAVDEPTPELLLMTVDVPAARLLVLQDQFYPGWKVDLDGQPAELIRCNGFMRGVLIPKGLHKVRFSYQPNSVSGGLMLAALGLLWFLLLLRPLRLAITGGCSKPLD